MSGEKKSYEEYLQSIREGLAESVEYFDSSNKSQRERWVVKKFLSNLGESFSETEVQAVEDDPPDVRFRQAEFEVKEILDSGRRRHTQYKEALARANAAESPEELHDLVPVRSVSYEDVFDRIEGELAPYSKQYPPAVKAQLDLIFYVNLENVFEYFVSPLPAQTTWGHYGFRSVSLVMAGLSGVLMASSEAPDFRRVGAPRVVSYSC